MNVGITLNTAKKPKGMKILGIMQEDPTGESERTSQSKVTRLKNWTEFFELEEFQECSVKMLENPEKKKKFAKQSQNSD